MPLVENDITNAGAPSEGDHTATVTKVTYQIKTGEKWNNDGTSDVDFATWSNTPPELARIRYGFMAEGNAEGLGGGFISREFYMKETALGFLKDFLTKCGTPPTKAGFDPEAPFNKKVGIHVTMKQSVKQVKDEFGTVISEEAGEPRAEIDKFFKV